MTEPKGADMVEPQTEAQVAFARSPRPLNFIRVRLYRGGQAELVRNLVSDEVDQLFEDLGRLRGEGKHDGDPEVQETTNNIRHLNSALKDINNGLIELVGSDGY